MLSRCHLRGVFGTLLAFVLLAKTGLAQDEPVRWTTGLEFRQQMENLVGVAWSGNSLRDALRNLSHQQRVAIFVDRRVDPDQRLEFTSENTTLAEMLSRLAKRLKLGTCQVGSVVYIGPVDTSQKLATVAAIRRSELAALTSDAKRLLVASQAWKWEELSEPRALLTELLNAARISAADKELQKIPHDLWPQVELPPMPWSDRLTLLLVGFDLTFQVSKDGSAIRFGRFPEQVTYVQTYAARGEPAKVAAELTKKFPDTEIQAESGRLRVAGRFEDHELIDRLLRGERIQRTSNPSTATIFTLNVERQPFGVVAKTLANKLMFQIEIAPGLETQLSENVSFQVKDASLNELLDALAKAGRVRYQLEGQNLKILAP